MKFLQHCFIRKNTPELREKLESFGYRHNDLDDNSRPWLAANHGMYISVDEGFHRLPLEDIDCGENEEMFLALAALNNENDYAQWFIYDDTEWNEENPSVFWHLCESASIEWDLCYNLMFTDARKATVEEIVEHFKKENPQ